MLTLSVFDIAITGLTLAYPLMINMHFIDEQGAKISPPSPWMANLNIAQRLTLWERAFNAGKVIPILSLITAASLTAFALSSGRGNDSALLKRLGSQWQTRKKLLLGSAAFTGSLLVFTLLAIMPTNKKLMALRLAANNKEEVNVAVVEALFARWTQLHNVRVAAAFSGFALAVYSFLGF